MAKGFSISATGTLINKKLLMNIFHISIIIYTKLQKRCDTKNENEEG